MRAAMAAIENSPVVQFHRQLEQSPLIQLQKQLANWDPFREHREALEQMAERMRLPELDGVAAALDSAMKFSELERQIESMRQATAASEIFRTFDVLRLESPVWESMRITWLIDQQRLADAVAAFALPQLEFVGVVDDVFEGDDQQPYASAFDLVVRVAVELREKFPEIDSKTLINFVMTLIAGLIVAMYQNAASHADIERTHSDLQAIRSDVDAVKAEITHKLTLQTKRIANLRDEPSASGKLVLLVPAGALVEELDRDERGWRYVRYKTADVDVAGWVYYTNLSAQP